MKDSNSFGGKIAVMGGDFRQVLPILPHASRDAIVGWAIKNSNPWKEVRFHRFVRNMRAALDAEGCADCIPTMGNCAHPLPAEDGSTALGARAACEPGATLDNVIDDI